MRLRWLCTRVVQPARLKQAVSQWYQRMRRHSLHTCRSLCDAVDARLPPTAVRGRRARWRRAAHLARLLGAWRGLAASRARLARAAAMYARRLQRALMRRLLEAWAMAAAHAAECRRTKACWLEHQRKRRLLRLYCGGAVQTFRCRLTNKASRLQQVAFPVATSLPLPHHPSALFHIPSAPLGFVRRRCGRYRLLCLAQCCEPVCSLDCVHAHHSW